MKPRKRSNYASLSKPRAASAQPSRPRIVIVATGGTIAGTAESTTAAGYRSGAVAVDVLIAAVPQMQRFADVRGVQVSSLGSQDMDDEHWVMLATEVNRLLAAADVDGVAITHGTDTMEETAYFLNLVVKSDKPVVLTGSMRPSTSLGADGPLNIYNAVGVASDPRARGSGVLVVANDDIHDARAMTKRHTTDVQTFVSPEVGLIGVCLFDDREFVRSPVRAHTTATPFAVATGQVLPRVDVIYAHAGMSPDVIDGAVANGAKGLVVAGVGHGNMTTRRSTRSSGQSAKASWWCARRESATASSAATSKSTTTRSERSRRRSSIRRRRACC